MGGCTHHILKSVNCVYYCQLCGARVDAPKPAEEKPERKIGFESEPATEETKKKAAARRGRKKGETGNG